MQDNDGRFYNINGKYLDSCNAESMRTCDSIDRRTDIKARIYEVIRVVDMVPLFLEQHVERLNKSLAAFSDKIRFPNEEIDDICRNLCTRNNVENCNIQLTYYIYNDGNHECIHYVKKHFYPDADMYREGVKTDVIHLGRSNPSVKNYVPEYKQKVKDAMKDNFELLLVNEKGEILEGSRSNFFYVKGDDVYTCPTELVLNGITRINVIKSIENAGLNLHEVTLKEEDVAKIDGAFLSGTSINVLPIASIGSTEYRTKGKFPTSILKIIDSFDEILENYIERCTREH